MPRTRHKPPGVLTVDRVRELLRYDLETGVFTWRRTAGPAKTGAAVRGEVTESGYLRIVVDGCRARAHRLAWFYVYGAWPEGEVDHINGNRMDNRIANLRVCSRSENSKNRRLSRSNTSGFKGVHWHKRLGKWVAKIKVDGRHVHLGCFGSPGEAFAAYKAAAPIYHGEFHRIDSSSLASASVPQEA